MFSGVVRIIIGIITFLSVQSVLYSQSLGIPEDFLSRRKLRVMNYYQNFEVGSLITGNLYIPDVSNEINNRFFITDSDAKGSIVYDGFLIDNIPVQYDLVDQQVIVLLKSKSQGKYLIVDQEKVSEFSIGGFRFVHLPEGRLPKGIYQIVYAGESSILFAQRRKIRTKSITSEKIVYQLFPQTDYYVKNEHGTFKIRDRKDLIKAYNTKDFPRDMIKKKKLKLSRKNIEESLLSVMPLLEPKIRDNQSSN